MKPCGLAARLGATPAGDPEAEVTFVAGLEDAGPGQIAFGTSLKYTSQARACPPSSNCL